MKEYSSWSLSGFGMLALSLLVLAGGITMISLGGAEVVPTEVGVPIGLVLLFASLVLFTGLFMVQPNQVRVVTFFGRYLGTVRDNGLRWGIPFSNRKSVSLRMRNFNSVKLKVNDIEGNPIEIAAVVVYRVVDGAKALFDVDAYVQFVEIQSETALRHVASKYPYDSFKGGFSLRGNADEIANELQIELQERLAAAGVEVVEARLTHLAYAQEIAGAMLQRQQSAAIVAAREIIVEGALAMVQGVLESLEKDGIVQLDPERKAAMINNLMVTIVSERAAQPIVNAGSLY